MDVTTVRRDPKLDFFFFSFCLWPAAQKGNSKLAGVGKVWQICLSLIDCSLFRQREGGHRPGLIEQGGSTT